MTGDRGPHEAPHHNDVQVSTSPFRTIANLIGWAVVGVLLMSLIGLVPVLGIVLAPYVAGGVIGDRVGRWPGWVAASAAVVWSLWWSARSDDAWIVLGMLSVSLLVSVATARYRWGLRPDALSASLSR